MARPARARIDLAALRANLAYARELAGSAGILAVVKANGYGHGAVPVARALCGEVGCGPADALGVACLEEALELRESGISAPILLMEGVFAPEEIPLADRLDLSLVVHCAEQLAWLAAARPVRHLKCWIKLDTGMHRVGFAAADFPAALAVANACPHLAPPVLMTHFARADEPEHLFTAHQIARFEEATAGLDGLRSLANSAGLIAWPRALADWVRPGIMLYGASPFGDAHPSAPRLRPVMSLESALIATRDLTAGETVGYGGRFVCERPMRIGIVALGYADGYPRHAPDGTPAAVAGRPTRIVGRVSMDMLAVDLTDLPDARPGDPVELWGAQVSANAVAQASGTIAYQLFTGVSPRVPRSYEGGEDVPGTRIDASDPPAL